MDIEITEALARKCLATVDAGLVAGLGRPKPGHMCVEAAINYALGEPHGDNPACVAPTLRAMKIRLNDSNWSTNDARTKGLRRLALAQLGSAGVLEEAEFVRRVVRLAIQKAVPQALRAAAKFAKGEQQVALLHAAKACEDDPTRANAVSAKEIARTAAAAADAADAYAAAIVAVAVAAAAAAYAAADDAYAVVDAAYAYAAAARDQSLAAFCEDVVQILIEMKAPGCQWLFMTEQVA